MESAKTNQPEIIPVQSISEKELEQQGYVTPSKATSVTYVSLFVWVITLVLYRVLLIAKICPDYPAFCFVASLVLSILGSWFIVAKMNLRKESGSKFVLILMNTFVIYTSANGIQAGNAKLSVAGEGETCEKTMSLIPWLTAKPWLRDKESETIISQLRSEVMLLKTSLEESRKLTNTSTAELSEAFKVLQKENDGKARQVDELMARINAFNELQKQWIVFESGLDSLQRGKLLPCIQNTMKEFIAPDYYTRLFTPIDTTLR